MFSSTRLKIKLTSNGSGKLIIIVINIKAPLLSTIPINVILQVLTLNFRKV